MSAGLKSTIGFVFAIVVMLIFVVIAESPLTTAATDEVSQTFTSADANGGTVTLTRRNWFNDLTRMTITGATSGSLTATSTIDADRVTLTLNGGLDSENVTVVHSRPWIRRPTRTTPTTSWCCCYPSSRFSC